MSSDAKSIVIGDNPSELVRLSYYIAFGNCACRTFFSLILILALVWNVAGPVVRYKWDGRGVRACELDGDWVIAFLTYYCPLL